MSEHAFHIKCFTFPGTFSFHMLDQNPAISPEFKPYASPLLASSHKARYPDFTEYIPFLSSAQYKKSGCGISQRGISLILWASNDTKHSSIFCSFQQPRLVSIKSATFMLASTANAEDVTLPPKASGIQLTLNTLMDNPSPTLHFAPLEITFLAFKMLFQANNPQDCFASKIVPFGKYFDLNTL